MKKALITAVILVCYFSVAYPQNMSGKTGITADAYGRVAIRQSASPRGELAPVVSITGRTGQNSRADFVTWISALK
jgi:hypothetical protein